MKTHEEKKYNCNYGSGYGNLFRKKSSVYASESVFKDANRPIARRVSGCADNVSVSKHHSKEPLQGYMLPIKPFQSSISLQKKNSLQSHMNSGHHISTGCQRLLTECKNVEYSKDAKLSNLQSGKKSMYLSERQSLEKQNYLSCKKLPLKQHMTIKKPLNGSAGKQNFNEKAVYPKKIEMPDIDYPKNKQNVNIDGQQSQTEQSPLLKIGKSKSYKGFYDKYSKKSQKAKDSSFKQYLKEKVKSVEKNPSVEHSQQKQTKKADREPNSETSMHSHKKTQQDGHVHSYSTCRKTSLSFLHSFNGISSNLTTAKKEESGATNFKVDEQSFVVQDYQQFCAPSESYAQNNLNQYRKSTFSRKQEEAHSTVLNSSKKGSLNYSKRNKCQKISAQVDNKQTGSGASSQEKLIPRQHPIRNSDYHRTKISKCQSGMNQKAEKSTTCHAYQSNLFCSSPGIQVDLKHTINRKVSKCQKSAYKSTEHSSSKRRIQSCAYDPPQDFEQKAHQRGGHRAERTENNQEVPVYKMRTGHSNVTPKASKRQQQSLKSIESQNIICPNSYKKQRKNTDFQEIVSRMANVLNGYKKKEVEWCQQKSSYLRRIQELESMLKHQCSFQRT